MQFRSINLKPLVLGEKRPDSCLSLHMLAQILSQRTYLKDKDVFFNSAYLEEVPLNKQGLGICFQRGLLHEKRSQCLCQRSAVWYPWEQWYPPTPFLMPTECF